MTKTGIAGALGACVQVAGVSDFLNFAGMTPLLRNHPFAKWHIALWCFCMQHGEHHPSRKPYSLHRFFATLSYHGELEQWNLNELTGYVEEEIIE